MNRWTKEEVIALTSVVVTFLGVVVPVITPEVPCSVFKDCPARKGDSYAPVTNNDPTPSSLPEPKPVQPPIQSKNYTSPSPSETKPLQIPTTTDIPTTGQEELEANYTRLKNLLAAGDFKGADQETNERMRWVKDKVEKGWDRFPCQDLLTIDSLWHKYSNGKYGFKAQKEILIEAGGTSEVMERIDGNLIKSDMSQVMAREELKNIYRRFGEKGGWLVGDNSLSYDDLIFGLRGNKGHLPIKYAWNMNRGMIDLFTLYLFTQFSLACNL
ncbi:GUN4 domain-containing protein [Nostoc sp. CHAB 5844]|nr:GUN4 domain-containing protein [Nostoc sp. CHAB 5844]